MGMCSLKQQPSVNLKIMSYNIRHGEGLDTILDLSRSAAIIKSQSPDLVGLQEVDHFCSRTDSIGQTKYLAQLTNMTGSFGAFMDYQGGQYGMATLSAKPLTSTKVLRLPDALYEPRTAIIHEVQLAQGCTIVFANVHLDWIDNVEGSANRLKQAESLLQYIDSLNKATIITGDFNCTPDAPTMRYFAEQGFVFIKKGEDNLSFQGESKSEIDHLIYRDSEQIKFIENSIKLLKEPIVSDHRPLVVEMEVTY